MSPHQVSPPKGLYIHIPFCARKCHYCNFVITTKQSPDFRRKFFQALEHETLHAVSRYGRLNFETFYLGGGTPSLLTIEELHFIVNLFHKQFDFKPDFEFTIELNPEDSSLDKLKTYRKLGVTRLSIGAQSFESSLLQNMGRIHDEKAIEIAIEQAHNAGFENISLDLIIRLPGQNLEQVKSSIERAIRLGVKQITLYDLEVHQNTVYGHRRLRGVLALPDEELHSQMYQIAYSLLTKNGFEPYEITTFAKPGFESRHNLIYWHNQEYLGLGPGAFSYLNGIRSQFSTHVESYIQKCMSGNWINDVEDKLTDEQKEMETLLTGLRLQKGTNLDQFKIIRGKIDQKLPSLMAAGLVELKDSRLSLTLAGRKIPETIFLEFI